MGHLWQPAERATRAHEAREAGGHEDVEGRSGADHLFAQLGNSKVKANFADVRTYTYGGEKIDTAYHPAYTTCR